MYFYKYEYNQHEHSSLAKNKYEFHYLGNNLISTTPISDCTLDEKDEKLRKDKKPE